MGGAETEIGDTTRERAHRGRELGPRVRSPAPPVGTSCRARRRSATSAASTREIAATAASRVAQLLVDLAGGTADVGGSLIRRGAGAHARSCCPTATSPASSASSTPTTRCTTRSQRSAARSTPRRRRLRRSCPPSWRPDLTGTRRARRGGRPHRRLRPHPVGAAGRAARTRAHPLAAHPAPGRRHARGRRAHRGAGVPVRHRGRERGVRQRRRVARGIRAPRERARRRAPRCMRTVAAARAHRGRAAATARAASPTCAVRDRQRVPAPTPGAPTAAPELPVGDERPSDDGPRDAAGGHPAAAAARRRALPRRRRHEAAGPGARRRGHRRRARRRARRSRWPSAPTSRSRRDRTRRCTRVAPPSCGSAGRTVGFAGELLPALAEEADLPRVVAVVELDLDALIELTEPGLEAGQIGTFPAATQDLSLAGRRRRAGGRRRGRRARGRGRAARAPRARRRLPRRRRARGRRRASPSRCASAPRTAR